MFTSATSSYCVQYFFLTDLLASALSSSSMSVLTFGELVPLLASVVAVDGGHMLFVKPTKWKVSPSAWLRRCGEMWLL